MKELFPRVEEHEEFPKVVAVYPSTHYNADQNGRRTNQRHEEDEKVRCEDIYPYPFSPSNSGQHNNLETTATSLPDNSNLKVKLLALVEHGMLSDSEAELIQSLLGMPKFPWFEEIVENLRIQPDEHRLSTRLRFLLKLSCLRTVSQLRESNLLLDKEFLTLTAMLKDSPDSVNLIANDMISFFGSETALAVSLQDMLKSRICENNAQPSNNSKVRRRKGKKRN
jgi:hypothetical protein